MQPLIKPGSYRKSPSGHPRKLGSDVNLKVVSMPIRGSMTERVDSFRALGAWNQISPKERTGCCGDLCGKSQL